MRRRTACRRLAGGLLGTGTLAGAGCLGRPSPGTGGPNQASADPTAPHSANGSADDVSADDAPDASGRPADWPSFGVDDGNAGHQPAATGPATGRVAWTGIGDAPTVNCSPVLHDGTVYVGSAANRVHAFDAASGEVRWEHGTESYVPTAPAVADGTVFAADADGRVYALDAADGTEAWTHDTEKNLHSRCVTHGDGTLYVGTAGEMPAVVSGDTDATKESSLVALDAATGERQWGFDAPDWFTGPAVGGGRVYAGNHTGDVFALSAESGEEVWSWRGAGEDGHGMVDAPPTYRDGTVYVAVHGRGSVVALDAATGDVEWERELAGANVKSSPATDGERVYVGAHRIVAVPLEGDSTTDSTDSADETDETDETDTTDTPTPSPEERSAGFVHALDVESGEVAWRHRTGPDVRSSPAVTDEGVYVGADSGLVGLEKSDGTERWRVEFDRYVDSSPCVGEGRVWVGSADGTLYCVGGSG